MENENKIACDKIFEASRKKFYESKMSKGFRVLVSDSNEEFINLVKGIYSVKPLGFDMFRVKSGDRSVVLSVSRVEDAAQQNVHPTNGGP